MGYNWINSSWQRMEAIGRQEMAYSKLARARSNCYKDGCYDGNAYRGSNYRNGHYTHRRQMCIGNFYSHAKTFDYIPYEYYCENSPYDVHKRYHGSNDYGDQNCGKSRGYQIRCQGKGKDGTNRILFCDVMGQRDHSLFVNVLHQFINLDRTHLLVVQHSFHDILVCIAHNVEHGIFVIP
ncbi:hypothetical protein M9H77_18543 [Catharanthus roseus]|uniref:Uncharacterized protein n=1 Tax=Catharanthus roseus TaxID=4058 RepID=A0ACC0B7S5_CATRO|nr:hypothetical protein M9H77_18543 [Catharanthus roseus]